MTEGDRRRVAIGNIRGFERAWDYPEAELIEEDRGNIIYLFAKSADGREYGTGYRKDKAHD